MKLWFKYLLGISLGIFLSFVLPPSVYSDGKAFKTILEISIRLGSLMLSALLFFSIPLAVYKLFENQEFWKYSGKNIAFFLLSLFAMGIVGLLIGISTAPMRIPLLSDTASQPIAGVSSILLKIVPANLADVFTNSTEYLLPMILLAYALGLAFAHDPLMVRPLMSLSDVLSRTLYLINTFITEILGALLIPISAASAHAVWISLSSGVYNAFYLLLLGEFVFFIFVATPAMFYFASGKMNPFPALYALTGPALAAFVSGNLRFAAGCLVKHANENLGIKRRYSNISLPIGIFFGRAGTALVTAATFIAILSSYSQISLSFFSLLGIVFLVPSVAVIGGLAPQQGPIIAITLLCSFFGKGFENGYLTVVPLALPLSMFAALMDTIWIGAVSAAIAQRQNLRELKSPKNYI